MHNLHRANLSRDKVIRLLEMAVDEAVEMEDAANNAGIVSPTPAEATLLKRTIENTLTLAIGNRDASRFRPENMVPPALSYEERKALRKE